MIKYFLSLLLLIHINFLLAQGVRNMRIAQMNPNTLYFSMTVEKELWVFYERIFKQKNGLEIGYGKKWSDREESELSNKTDQAQFYAGNMYMIDYKRFFYINSNKHPYYLSLLLLYKDYHFNPIYILHDTSDPILFGSGFSQNCQIRSSHKQVGGYKLLFGKKLNFQLGEKLTFVMDFYTGFGFRKRIFTDWVYGDGETKTRNVPCNCTPYPQPKSDNTVEVLPTVHFGLKLGLGF